MENKVKTNGTAKVTIGEKTVELPILKGSVGPDVVDIRKLYGETDVFTFDPGFTSLPPAAKAKLPTSTATRASSFIADILSTSWRSIRAFLRSATCS
jgi:hypothetical protein